MFPDSRLPDPKPLRRPRRNRRSEGLRTALRETHLGLQHLVTPLFVKEGLSQPEPIDSLPGIFRFSPDALLHEIERLHGLGLSTFALFPCLPPESKDLEASEALNPDNLINRCLRRIKTSLPGVTLISDVALDPYTTHGHDGILDPSGNVANDATVTILARMALLQAQAGVDYVAPSDMMDGRVRAIRHTLDLAGHESTGILAYSSKFASAYYGPFRDAVGSRVSGSYLDKRSYQLDPANSREALLEALLDEEEGADILMVKPAGLYLDILSKLRQKTLLPLAAYQVSGEYAQIHAAAQNGWLDLKQARDESLLAIRRAGADLIFSYFAPAIAAESSI
ncbi:MAG: porphobilinogen synthase [Blastochloris sp.]|nr:porphobilinogen synthase [Blastochloris sp.]